MSDPVTANHEAIAVIGNIVKRQALIIGLIDTLSIVGAVLTIAAVVPLLAQGYGRIRRSHTLTHMCLCGRSGARVAAAFRMRPAVAVR